jgi:hypothetical protein
MRTTVSERKTVIFGGVALVVICSLAVSPVPRTLADSPSPFHFAVQMSAANANRQLMGIGPGDAPVRSAVLTQSDRDHIKVQEAHWGSGGGYRGYGYGPRYYAGYGPRYYAGYSPYYSYYSAPYYNYGYYPTPYVAAYPSYSYFPAPYYSYPPIYTAVPRRAFYAPRGYYYW